MHAHAGTHLWCAMFNFQLFPTILWLKFRSCYRFKEGEWICKQNQLAGPKFGLLLPFAGTCLGQGSQGRVACWAEQLLQWHWVVEGGLEQASRRTSTKNSRFCSAEYICFPSMRNQRLKQYGCSSKKLCSVFVLPQHVSPQLCCQWRLWTYFWELCSVINIPCCSIWEDRAPYWPPLTCLWVYLGSD